MDWDTYFMLEAYIAAIKSKDTRTQVGACIVNSDNSIIAKGYNGPCRGEHDENIDIYQKPLKNFLFEHAERNAIYSLSRNGIVGKGCVLYCNLHPCVDCARGIIQTGIIEIILHYNFPDAHNFTESQRAAKDLLLRTKLPVRWWYGKFPMQIPILSNGIQYLV